MCRAAHYIMNPTYLLHLTANPTSPSGVLLGECSKCMELKIRTGNTIYLMTSCLVINSVGFALPRWLQAYVITPRNDISSISSRWPPTFIRGDRVTTWRPTQGQQHCNMTPSAMLPSLSPCSAVTHAESRTQEPFWSRDKCPSRSRYSYSCRPRQSKHNGILIKM